MCLDSGLVLVSVLTVSDFQAMMPTLLPFHHYDLVLVLDPEGVVE